MARALVVMLLTAGSTSAQTPASAPFTLAGTSWRLVSFQGRGEKPVIPGEAAGYVIDFYADGQLRARIDCNGGRARWTSSAPGEIRFGPLGLTREKCKPSSLSDRIVKDWPTIRSYALKANNLFLSVSGGSGTYEFRAMPPKEPVTTAVASIGPVAYDCAQNGGRGGALQATFYQTQPAMVLVERDGRMRPAFAVPAASGAKYEGKDLVFWDTKGRASVIWAGTTLTCQRR